MTGLSTRPAAPAHEPQDGSGDAAALLRSNRRRRAVRRWVAIGTLPLTLAALLFVGKLLSMYAFAHQAITAYVVDDFAGAEGSARGQEFLNWFEPYKAPFNIGTALGAAEQLPEARAELEEALDLATGLEVCGVRINLALVIERMGDAARADGDGATAADLYGQALTVTVETPEECHSDQAQQQSSDPQRDMSDTLDGTEDRLKQKQQEQEQQEQPQPQPEENEQPSEDKLQGLQDKLEQGTQERDQQQGDDPGGSGTDKPW
ncbi:tetratricopeptide repeat protein [Microbacterium sp. NPDC028030]|uniref:tetratricopeptide repeat protein n=1 Tax=Microbacterium sp. NPDC028030 TaxID=3155124 RepID=UPI0033C0E28E